VSGACGIVVLTDTVTISSVGMDEMGMRWTLSPNPTEGFLNVQGELMPDAYRITDLAGRTLADGPWPTGNRLDLRSLAAGTYIVELQRGNRTERSSVVKF
jgi:hypothetical protein